MAEITLEQLPDYLNRVQRAITDDVNALVRSISYQVAYQLIERTPVDVGTARSSWIVTLNAPSDDTRRAYSPFKSRWRPTIARTYYAAGGTRAEAQNLRPALGAANAALRPRQTDQDVYISNNLPYIERLANGWSRQSGPGLILLGVDRGVQDALYQFRFANMDRL